MLAQNDHSISLSSRLPNEILAEIFQVACQPSDSSGRSTLLRVVSQICHRWRHVALGYGQLWTQADYQLDHPEWFREQLRRSANVPVIVKAHFPMPSNRGMQNLRLALEEAAIHTLDIQAPPEILDRVFSNLDGLSLRTLTLFIPWSKMPNDIPYPGPTFQLNAPLLRTLALSNFVVSWDAPIFNNLTHLRLHLQDSAFAPSMTQILGMLACSPLLTELILLHAIETSTRLPCPESVSVVPLTRLMSLLLDDDILNHIFLLRHIDIPIHCSLSLKVENRTKKMSLITEIGHSISRVSLSTREIDKLVVELDPWSVVVRGYIAAKPANPVIQVTLRHRGTFAEAESASVACTMLCSLPLAATTALELAFRDPHSAAVPAETWRMCLQTLGAFKSLQIKPTTPRSILSALTVSAGDGYLLLPRLQSFEVHQPDLGPARPKVGAGHLGNWWQGVQPEVTFIDILLTCLKSHQQSQAQITSLRLPPCPEKLDCLKAVAKNISWC